MDVSFSGILSHIEVGGTVFIGKGLLSEYTYVWLDTVLSLCIIQ